MKVRLAMRALPKSGPSDQIKSLDDVAALARIPWIELDGTKFEDVVSVTFEANHDGVAVPVVVLAVAGPLEIVPVDRNGDEIGTISVTIGAAEQFGEMDYETIVELPVEEPGDPADPDA